ncbi:MAG TPA: hypothetical protein VG844_17770 [Terracidiphilus sp.]|nr:hypothetical protein [Terracidiphilus sp.]
MNIVRIRLASMVLPALAAAAILQAQSKWGISADGQVACVIVNGAACLNRPVFTATWKTTRVETLPDGKQVTHISGLKLAQDALGRLYKETDLESPEFSASPSQPEFIANVTDPPDNLSIDWNSGSKVAKVFHGPERGERPRAQESSVLSAPVRTDAIPVPPIRVTQGSGPEDLGTRTIGGMEARGTRYVQVIPAGAAGNKKRISIVTDRWYAINFDIEVLRVTDDPRYGKITTELTSLDRDEPDPALFQPPDGYQVVDVYPGAQGQSAGEGKRPIGF